jgi:nucleoside-diphosphate-sugar epimerase
MNPVLLTGATGFIGQHLQSKLLAESFEVVGMVRPSSSHKNTLAPGTRKLLCDLADSSQLISTIQNASAFIYCAGSVRGRNLEDFRAANIAGVRSVVEAMNRAGNSIPLILISSLAASRPQVSDYANSKYLGEQEVIRNADFPWTIMRPPAVYGPGDREMLPILKLARKGLVTPVGPAEQKLSLIHVQDVSSAIVACLKNPDACEGKTFSMDDGHEGGYDWDEIARASSKGRYHRFNIPDWIIFAAGHLNLALARMLGYAPMLTPGKARELTQTDWVCNNTALNQATGWSPEIDLKQGVNSLFEDRGD